MISMGGNKSKVLVLARSIEEYLRDHYDKLRSNYYYNGRGELECMPTNPLNGNGSVTTTNGVRIEAVGKHFHFYDEKEHYSQQLKYFFSY